MTKVRRGKSSWAPEVSRATRDLNSSSARFEDTVPMSARSKERLRIGLHLRRKRQKMSPPEVD
jgi:hypothetical protein